MKPNGQHIVVHTDAEHAESGNAFEVRPGVPELDDLQQHVGGLIDAFTLFGTVDGRRVTLWLHDEGLLLGLPPSVIVAFNTDEGTQRHVFVGPVLITATDAEGETVGLTDEEVEEVFKCAQAALLLIHRETQEPFYVQVLRIPTAVLN